MGKKVSKSQKKIDKLSLKDEMNNKQTTKLTKHENRIVSLLNSREVLDASALITDPIVSEGEIPTDDKLDENQPGENSRNRPPSRSSDWDLRDWVLLVASKEHPSFRESAP